MGGKASSLIWCDPNSSPYKNNKSSAYLYCYKLPPPSFNCNWSDLHYAASHGNVRRIKEIILKSGTGNLNLQDYYGKTPLYWAAYKGHEQCVEALLIAGALANIHCRHGGTPLHAVSSLYPECALLLIKYGADVDVEDNWGVTPMFIAASSGQLEVINYLLAAGATPTFRSKKTGEIPKQLLVQKDFCNALLKLTQNPVPLQQLCRIRIRSQLKEPIIPKIEMLRLPKTLKEHLSLSELG